MATLHFRNTRYFVNGGICVPECMTQKLINISNVKTTGDLNKVSCKKCLKLLVSNKNSRLRLAVNNYAEGAITLEVGQVIASWKVIGITTHTITFKDLCEGWETSIQIPFLDSQGNVTLAGAMAQQELINGAFNHETT